MSDNIVDEFDVLKKVHDLLDSLDEEAQIRVLNYVANRLGISTPRQIKGEEDHDAIEILKGTDPENGSVSSDFAEFAELYDEANPGTNPEKALVAGYWLQVVTGDESFSSQAANTELKNLGQGIANITDAINGLKNQKPALALQLRKSGSSKQSRKTYKITIPGIKRVEEMIGA